MVKIVREYRFYLFISFILSISIYSFDIFNRLPLSLNDEALYILGDNSTYPGFGPLYSSYYKLLQYFFSDKISVFYFQSIFISLIAFPLITFLFLKKIKLNIYRNYFITLTSTLAYWNLPNENKVHIFNYVYIFGIYLFFHRTKKGNNFIFYILLTLSLFIRQDNLVILIGFIILDHFKYAFISSICFFLFSLIFTNPFSKTRSLDTFIDHLYFSNLIDGKYIIPLNIHYKNYFLQMLNGPNSFLEIVFLHPAIVAQHVLDNISQTHLGIVQIFSLGINQYFYYPYLNYAIIIFFSIITLTHKTDDEIQLDFSTKKLLILITLKCLITCLVLSWWTKYSFELYFVIFIVLLMIIDRFLKTISWKYFKLILLFFPLFFIGYTFKPFKNNNTTQLISSITLINSIESKGFKLNILGPNNLKAYLNVPVKIFDPITKPNDYKQLNDGVFNLEQFSIIILPQQYQKDLANMKIQIAQSVLSLPKDKFVITHESSSNLIFAYQKSLLTLK